MENDGKMSELQEKMVKEPCPNCGGNLYPVGEGDTDQEVCLWCDTCDIAIDTTGGYLC